MTVGSGALFPQKANSLFLEVSRRKYDDLKQRLKKKKLLPIAFTLDQFREHFLMALGGSPDGAIQCRYCRKWCAPSDVAADHMDPLSRQGSLLLDNIGFPCQQCNQAKGGLTPQEFDELLAFLDPRPFMRRDVLARLAKTVKLAAGARRNAMRIKELEEKTSHALN